MTLFVVGPDFLVVDYFSRKIMRTVKWEMFGGLMPWLYFVEHARGTAHFRGTRTFMIIVSVERFHDRGTSSCSTESRGEQNEMFHGIKPSLIPWNIFRGTENVPCHGKSKYNHGIKEKFAISPSSFNNNLFQQPWQFLCFLFHWQFVHSDVTKETNLSLVTHRHCIIRRSPKTLALSKTHTN